MHTPPEERGLPLPYHSSSHEVSEYSLGSTEGESGNESGDRLFACPYSKRASCEDVERQSCSESGWTTIRRLRYVLRRIAYSRTNHRSRQHIYRCHVLPIKCPSCSQNFESRSKFTCHLHAVPHYDRSHCEADEPIKGLENILQKIRPTKATTTNASEEDMWKVIYTTLFPNDPKDEIPCTCEQSSPSPIFFLSSPSWDIRM